MSKRINVMELDQVIKLKKGKGLQNIDIAKQTGLSSGSITRILRVFELAKSGTPEEMAQYISERPVGPTVVEWAYDYHGVEVPMEIRRAMLEKHKTPTGDKVGDANIAVLMEKVNEIHDLLLRLYNELS